MVEYHTVQPSTYAQISSDSKIFKIINYGNNC